MQPRIVSSILVSALIRRVEAEGGFAAVLSRGDPTAGAIAVVLTERGREPRFYERLLQPDGQYEWQEALPRPADAAALQGLIDRRRRFDPDMWVLELDIASAERFAAEMNSIG